MTVRALTLLGFLCLGAVPLRADEVTLRSGKTARGFPIRRGAEVLLNEYGCSAPEMTLGVRRLRAVDITEITPAPLEAHLQARLDEFGPRDVARRVELLRLAQSRRARDWVARIAAEILRVQPEHAEARKAFGGADAWQAARRGDPQLDTKLAVEVRRMLRLESGLERRAFATRLAREYGYEPGAERIERMARSLQQDRGLHPDIVLRLDRRDDAPGRYALQVPADYDPIEARPLLIALHGGGMLQAKDKEVRGSPKDALALYAEDAQRLGWFLVCPAALESPWSSADNLRFLATVLDEVTTLWNIDLERVHLAGMGGGADGAWAWAARDADRFASVAIASGGKPAGYAGTAAKSALWMYHGEADEIRSVEPVRKAAARLLKRTVDSVYCELPKERHGFPPAARRDMFRFIGSRRRKRARDAWPLPSFATPSTRAAIAAFGVPEAAWGTGLEADLTPTELLARLREGRTEAEPVTRRLAERFAPAREELSEGVIRLVRDRKAPRAARLWATWLCGAWKDTQAVGALGDLLRTSKDLHLLRLAATSVAQIGSGDNIQDLRWALSDVSTRYRSLRGDRVAFQDFERICGLAACVVEAIGRCAQGAGDEFFAEIEEGLVRRILMDRRPIDHAPENGENPTHPRRDLAEAIARAYRRLEAEKTLFEMLLLAVRGDVASTSAVRRGMR